ncbi:hypothetical protein HDU79_002268 [Rhizoclosmatium sp. JEL0117]|nr:hypothetical protein HDU79_002268 [Rhizoclosmatium sp. JEL0117]
MNTLFQHLCFCCPSQPKSTPREIHPQVQTHHEGPLPHTKLAIDSQPKPQRQIPVEPKTQQPIEIHVSVEELKSLSKAAARLFELDTNRLQPGQDFHLNLQHETTTTNKVDQAKEPLFQDLDLDQLKTKPTYSKFIALLSNFVAQDGIAEVITEARLAQEKDFIDEIYKTAPIQYLHKYLFAMGKSDTDPTKFKSQLHSIWFDLYKKVVQNDSCAFENAFSGELRSGEVVGFHNWIVLAVEEKAGRANYRGFILPKGKNSKTDKPSGKEHVLGLQIEWRRDVKPMSTFLVGVSPEYELALYTLVFLVGRKSGAPLPITIGNAECEVVVTQLSSRSGQKIASAFVKFR